MVSGQSLMRKMMLFKAYFYFIHLLFSMENDAFLLELLKVVNNLVDFFTLELRTLLTNQTIQQFPVLLLILTDTFQQEAAKAQQS